MDIKLLKMRMMIVRIKIMCIVFSIQNHTICHTNFESITVRAYFYICYVAPGYVVYFMFYEWCTKESINSKRSLAVGVCKIGSSLSVLKAECMKRANLSRFTMESYHNGIKDKDVCLQRYQSTYVAARAGCIQFYAPPAPDDDDPRYHFFSKRWIK